MKKFYLLALVFAFLGVSVFAQQKKPVTKPKTTTTPAKKPTTTPAKKPTSTTTKPSTTTPKTTDTKTKSTSTDSKKATDTKTKTTTTKTKSADVKKEQESKKQADLKQGSKKRKAALPYYQIQNFLTINFGFFYFKAPRTTTLPVYFNPEITLSRNMTIGIQAMHFQYKSFTQFKDKESADYGYSEFKEYSTKYNHLLAALKLSYHLNDIVRDNLSILVNPEKMDLYVSGLAGYNFVFPKPTSTKFSKLRLGFAVGGRILYSKRLAFFMEYGFSDYGYGSLGASWLLGERF